MKLIRWVEVHIGRSRRKVKKEARGQPGGNNAPDSPCQGTPTPAKKGVWPPRGGRGAEEPLVTSSPLPASRGGQVPASRLPELEEDSLELMDGSSGSQPGSLKRLPPHIRTSFAQETTESVAGSPRQRSRIRTNPWLPSPRSSCSSSASGDSGLGARSSSADSPEPPFGVGAGSVFGSSQVLATAGGRGSSSSASTVASASSLRSEAPRSLERSTRPPGPWRSDPRSRSLPRTSGATPQWSKACPLAEGDSSDEAYSDDFVQSQEEEEEGRTSFKTLVQSPDSACAVSCGSTPLSEGSPAPSNTTPVIAPVTPTLEQRRKGELDIPRPVTPKDLSQETLEEKVRRLRVSHRRVDAAMREARQDDQRRREERLLCQQELLRCRRLLLLRTLHELRTRLELQGHRLQRAYSATLEMRHGHHLAVDEDDDRLWDSFE